MVAMEYLAIPLAFRGDFDVLLRHWSDTSVLLLLYINQNEVKCVSIAVLRYTNFDTAEKSTPS